ncbi:MAG TPA: thioredoxin domain-containing protein [Flavisolibacter sp.]|jgi:protein-disulfide isomerase
MLFKQPPSVRSNAVLKHPFNRDHDHYLGAPDAPLEIVLYGDFLCLFCGELYTTLKLLQQCFDRQVRLVYRHFPMVSLHSLSLEAALAAEAASLQGKFWNMHDLIFQNQIYLVRSSFSRFADELNLKSNPFGNSMGYKTLIYKVSSDLDNGIKNGVIGTPTLFINGTRYTGFHDLENLSKTCLHVIRESCMLFQ